MIILLQPTKVFLVGGIIIKQLLKTDLNNIFPYGINENRE
jgi:hypothetical protein